MALFVDKFQISKKSLRTVGCNTDDLIRALDLDPLSPVDDEFSWETVRDDVDFSYKKKMKGKAVQAGLVVISNNLRKIPCCMFENRQLILSYIFTLRNQLYNYFF